VPRRLTPPAAPLEGGDARSKKASSNELSWSVVDLGDGQVEYGHGGQEGPPVVFLHGWALGSRAYRRPISRLLERGCRVWVPALPAFGRTTDLPRERQDIDGYAQWVGAFMDKVGIAEPALVIGHSFGGGVALRLAASLPEKVAYLVLINSLGGQTPRPPWAWATGFAAELWPPWEALETGLAVGSDLVANLIRNPVGLMRVAVMAQGTDLTQEAQAVRELGIPVLAVSSEKDEVIPKQAFETLCRAIGSRGRTVSGRHAWLLANPDRFASATAAVVDVAVASHRRKVAATRSAELLRLVRATRMDRGLAQELVESAPALWLMSEEPKVLAGDLALCHPDLAPEEVRALARQLEGTSCTRLSVVARDRPGLLADSARAVTQAGLGITEAQAATWPQRGLALHSFVVFGARRNTAADWDSLGEALRRLGKSELTVATRAPQRVLGVLSLRVSGWGQPSPGPGPGHGADRSLIVVKARDRRGLLGELCGSLAAAGVNIEALWATSDGPTVTDSFVVAGVLDRQLLEQQLRRPARP